MGKSCSLKLYAIYLQAHEESKLDWSLEAELEALTPKEVTAAASKFLLDMKKGTCHRVGNFYLSYVNLP